MAGPTPRKRSNPLWVLASTFGQGAREEIALQEAKRRRAADDARAHEDQRFQDEQRARTRDQQAREDARRAALSAAGGDYTTASNELARTGDAEGASAYRRESDSQTSAATSRRRAERQDKEWEWKTGADILEPVNSEESYQRARQRFAEVLGQEHANALPASYLEFAPRKEEIVSLGRTEAQNENRRKAEEERRRNEQRATVAHMTATRDAGGSVTRNYGRESDELFAAGDFAGAEAASARSAATGPKFQRQPERMLIDGRPGWVLEGSDGQFYLQSDIRTPIDAGRVAPLPDKPTVDSDEDRVLVRQAEQWRANQLARLTEDRRPKTNAFGETSPGIAEADYQRELRIIEDSYQRMLRRGTGGAAAPPPAGRGRSEAALVRQDEVLPPNMRRPGAPRQVRRPPSPASNAAPFGPSDASPTQNTNRGTTGPQTVTRRELEAIALQRGTTVEEQERRATAQGFTVVR